MSKCWYCNNELTSGDNPKHFGICNKCYNEMFKSGDTIILSLTNKITELQKQLEVVKKAFELARKEELREIGIYDDDLDYDKEMSALEREYSEQAEKELKGENQ